MIIKIILLVIWIIASIIEGDRDAHFYFDRISAANPDKENMHWLFSMERFVIMLLICWIHVLVNSILNTGVFSISLILLFSFFHNGEYYSTRNKLDKNVYPNRWWSNSTTSESMIELSMKARTLLAIIGFLGIISTFIFK